jgi:polysaccharide export outer membrane protein
VKIGNFKLGKYPVAGLLLLCASSLSAQSSSGPTSFGQLVSQRPPNPTSASSVTKSGLADAAGGGFSTKPSEVPKDFVVLKLAPGFLIHLNVLDDVDFVGDFRVDQQGYLPVPIIGPIHVGGETASEARTQIAQMLLDQKILINPQVNLSVLEYVAPQVTLQGEVAAPGTYSLLAPRKLIDVLALGGGLTLLAGNQIVIVRGDPVLPPSVVPYSKATDPNLVEDVIVQPGDTVQVRRAGIVYVLGAVIRPGGYVMQEDGKLNLLEAITLAYGATPAASDDIFILHQGVNGSTTEAPLSYKRLRDLKEKNVELAATDIVYVRPSTIKTILSANSGLLSAAASASVYGVFR